MAHVSFERYIMWMIYQVELGRDILTRHPRAVVLPMEYTLKWSGDVLPNLKRGGDYRAAFFEAAHRCMRVRRDGKTKNPEWIGEKNPAEYADPEVMAFISRVHPDAKFIHMVRHPGACARSKRWFQEEYPDGRIIWDKPIETLVEEWVETEQYVLEAKAEGADIHTIRYESFCRDPDFEVACLYRFLEVENRPHHMEIRKGENAKHDLSLPDVSGLEELMERYGYNKGSN
jgi:hypothetical protein